MASNITINAPAIPNLPWEDKPAGHEKVLWRYSNNPVIPRDLIPCANAIYNSAVVPYQGGFAGVFRVDHTDCKNHIHAGRSKDGIHWEINPEPVDFICDDPEVRTVGGAGYDPRVVWLEDRYYITWCNAYGGPTIGVAYTFDFKTFTQIENAFLIYNRNGVLFPRKVKGKYCMLSRPSGPGHNPYGVIFYSESPDMIHWGKHRLVMKSVGGWQGAKIGPGPNPIETSEGWLSIYHGVVISCSGFVYYGGAALLDLDEPWKVIARSGPYILNPAMLYECVGNVPNVTFPCAAICDGPSKRMAIYYGAADTVVALAFCYADELVEFVKKNSVV